MSRNDELKHFGIKGMKWGIRRFENEDGTLTAEGRERYKKFKKGLVKGVETAANIATLGAYGDIKRAETRRNRAKNSKYGMGVTPRSGGQLGIRLIGHGVSGYWNHIGTAIVTGLGAAGVLKAGFKLAAKTGSPQVLAGAAAVSSVLMGMGTLRVGTVAAYETVGAIRDTRNYIAQPKKGKEW